MGTGYGSLAIDQSGKLWSWGYSPYGHLNYNGSKYAPFDTGITEVRQVVMGDYFTLYLLNNGDLYSMGNNVYGELGHSTNTYANTTNPPRKIMSEVRQVAAGLNFALAVKENGELWGWGRNYYGCLATSANLSTNNPTLPRLMDVDVRMCDASQYTSYWLKNDGSVWGAGYGGNYSLGNGQSVGNNTNPVRIMASGANKVFATGYRSAFILKENGELWGWGYNGYGNLGLNNTTQYTVPVFIRNGVTNVTGGNYYSLFLLTDGSVYGAGYNYYGNLGITTNMSTSNATYMRLVATNVRSIGCGYYHSIFVKNDGTMFVSGYNYNGQLGRGSSSGNYGDQVVIKNDMQFAMGYTNAFAVLMTGYSATSPIHKQATTIQATLTHSHSRNVKYRILVNGTQVLPTTGWSQEYSSPYILYRALDAPMFNMGSNTVLIQASDDTGTISSRTLTVVVTSAAPTINLTMTTTIHKNALPVQATISDPESDKVKYRLFLNNVKIYPTDGDWTDLTATPFSISHLILNPDLVMGANTVKIEMMDDMGITASTSRTVIKSNAIPSASGSITGSTIRATLNDPDGDPVKYSIYLNGTQVFPSTGMTQMYLVPFTLEYKFPTSLIKLGQNNVARVHMEDDMGGATYKDFTFIGDYSGLMFCDAVESYYSTDIGTVLKYLDFGTLIAGGSTQSARVWVKNTLGFPAKNIRLWADQRDLDGTNARLEISKTDAPFVPESLLVYPETINHGEKISFYVRVVTNRDALHGGMFDILTKADPA